MTKHRTHSIAFKRQVVQEYLAGETLHGLARRHELSRTLIRIWVDKYEAGAFDEDAEAASMIQEYEARIAALERVAELAATLDPIRLLRQMRAQQQRVADIADQPVAEPEDTAVPPLEQFLAGLRTAWAEGEARPTAKPPAKSKRERRRPDPLVRVTEQLHAWFEAEPWSTSRQLLERLQAAHPDEYPDGLLRTVQRRVKVWRREKATAMVFGELPAVESVADVK